MLLVPVDKGRKGPECLPCLFERVHGIRESLRSCTAICLAGKGNKKCVVPISPSMSSLLKEYMDTVHPIEQRQNRDYLFFTTLHDRRTRMLTRFVSMHGQIRRQSVAQSKKSLEIRANVPFRLFGKTMRRWESAFMD